jgi:hypothetical protein
MVLKSSLLDRHIAFYFNNRVSPSTVNGTKECIETVDL